MAAAGTNDSKSPKAPPRRPPKTPEARQVHFETQGILKGQNITGYTTASSPSGGFNANTATGSSKAAPKTPPAVTASEDNQPTSFPALGVAANSQLQWHTSANPTQSLRHQLPTGPGGFISPPPQQAAYFSLPQQHHPQIHPASYINAPAGTHNTVTYIGVGPPSNTMGDYQNAAPPPNGVHFQPPVPDTTFGPMQHVYVPRFDGGLAGVQVGLPAPASALASVPVPVPAHFVSAPAPITTTAACTTVVLPKTFYLNGYTYYASGLVESSPHFLLYLDRVVHRASLAQPVVGAVAPQPGIHASYVVHQQPYLVQQPAMGQQQPILVHGHQQHYVPQVQHVAGAVPAVGMAGGVAAMPGAVPIIAGNSGHIPDVTGIGRTAGEEQLRQIQFAHENRLYEPQDFKPADDDPSRFYYVREVDGNWTQRNRFTIDHMGDCRWYVTDEGWFYAVRLPS
ncbi:Hypothetical protein NCS54_01032900 [Fusarium falciforme]|uniref:Hypothetical protein n=1 Tax=Fusarium falciforme TaxID=195108 RepID=UPI00230145B2|nr:Hypothetical protein NCS54_01032900 [Fusarium falciforme]WAO92808.1 Hypothetical protein NCS54_01032900 [Fusarium falciforme]